MLKFNVNVPLGEEKNWKEFVYKKLRTREISDIVLLKKSLDARDKGSIFFVYQVAVKVKNEENFVSSGIEKYSMPIMELEKLLKDVKYSGSRPVVVGTGPCGLFAALSLAILGAKPVVLERGKAVEERIKDVREFSIAKKLNVESNIQFGEGGAGTFSDGKLNTGINNQYIPVVLKEFVESGADEEIMYSSKPHIGTDKLVDVVRNMRKKIIELGGEIHYNTKLTDIKVNNGAVVSAITDKGEFPCEKIYLAIGHSARDTFEMLYGKALIMESKTFSMGVRIEHNQNEINFAQYGKSSRYLPPADYKMAAHFEDKRSLYTFCMCPGGYVVNASSEEGGITVNGMSEFARRGNNANSALLVNVSEKDWNSDNPLAGVEYQRKFERLCYKISNSYLPPVQLFGDLLKNRVSQKIGGVAPSVGTGYVFGDLRSCLPNFVVESVILGVKKMANRLKGFDAYDSVLTGIEARSSSPIRLVRDEKYCSNIIGLYPLGEGAGYAGGIMSASVDGIKGVLATVAT